MLQNSLASVFSSGWSVPVFKVIIQSLKNNFVKSNLKDQFGTECENLDVFKNKVIENEKTVCEL